MIPRLILVYLQIFDMFVEFDPAFLFGNIQSILFVFRNQPLDFAQMFCEEVVLWPTEI